MKIHKILITAMVVILVTLFSGCVNKEEELQSEVTSLADRADQYYKEDKMDDALEVYEKALEKKESSEIRDKIDSIKAEIKSIEKARNFKDELYTIRKERLSAGVSVTPTDMKFIIGDLGKLVTEFDNIDTSTETTITNYVKEVKRSTYYELLKVNIDSPLHDDAEVNEALGAIDSDFEVLNSLTVAHTRNDLTDKIDKILEIPFPSQYE
ncbi:hypothetical protein [Paenibacillus sp. A3M_27_13]|uniref:hypothetical protein n=1 Tax=Paenibacillus sp. A3M_27_13 TaxID=2962029 RepID=UPI0020B6D37F|nr:hypothetical protein [Paenibacillus sp. A3M_27_13]MCP3747563.1 hypothetical protein [Paenibacillus sp. A3M_27_13]